MSFTSDVVVTANVGTGIPPTCSLGDHEAYVSYWINEYGPYCYFCYCSVRAALLHVEAAQRKETDI